MRQAIEDKLLSPQKLEKLANDSVAGELRAKFNGNPETVISASSGYQPPLGNGTFYAKFHEITTDFKGKSVDLGVSSTSLGKKVELPNGSIWMTVEDGDSSWEAKAGWVHVVRKSEKEYEAVFNCKDAEGSELSIEGKFKLIFS